MLLYMINDSFIAIIIIVELCEFIIKQLLMLGNLLEKSYDVESEAKQRTYLVSLRTYVRTYVRSAMDIYRYSDVTVRILALTLTYLYVCLKIRACSHVYIIIYTLHMHAWLAT